MDGHRVIVTKSTVPVGTTDRVRTLIAERLATRGLDIPFETVSNPEFLKEGAAVEDFMRPDRIVVGCEGREALELLAELYAPFNRNHNRLVAMGVRSAELTKYAANAMLAARISFMNEILAASMAFAAYLVSSAERTPIATRRLWLRLNGAYNSASSSKASRPSQPTTIRSGRMKSSTAAPSLRNSGLETVSNGMSNPRVARRSAIRVRTRSVVPTGTVDLVTMTRCPSIASPIVRATW